MAKRPPERGDNRDDLEYKKFKFDPTTNESFVNINDEGIVDAIEQSAGISDTNAEIINQNLVANTELEIDCGPNIKEYLIRSRTGKKLKLALNITETATKFITIERGAVYLDRSFYLNKKLYLLCEAADTVEVLIKRNA